MQPTCYYCRQPFTLKAGAYRVIGIDISSTPPVSLYACADCWTRHPVVLSAPEAHREEGAPATTPEPEQLPLW